MPVSNSGFKCDKKCCMNVMSWKVTLLLPYMRTLETGFLHVWYQILCKTVSHTLQSIEVFFFFFSPSICFNQTTLTRALPQHNTVWYLQMCHLKEGNINSDWLSTEQIQGGGSDFLNVNGTNWCEDTFCVEGERLHAVNMGYRDSTVVKRSDLLLSHVRGIYPGLVANM